MAKPAPPKIAPKPGLVKVVRALYGYAAQQEDELSFNEGDILYITEQDTNADWQGSLWDAEWPYPVQLCGA
jgi:hypothetical protein